jgi:tetratricopeptide (TPR) repeat protein
MTRIFHRLFALLVVVLAFAGLAAADVPIGSGVQGESPRTLPDDTSGRPAGATADDASTISSEPPENWLENAEALMAEGRFAEAAALLSAGVDRMPDGWQPINRDGDRVVLAAWDLGEFLRFSKDSDPLAGPGVVWVKPSYSKAYYLLAVIGVETGDAESAVNDITRAIELQPYHPLVMHEAAIIVRGIGGVVEALAVLEKADHVPAWLMTPDRRALLERSRGVTLVELGRLDEAEAALRASLDLEPDSAVARRELEYIAELRTRGEAAREPIVLTLLTGEGDNQ